MSFFSSAPWFSDPPKVVFKEKKVVFSLRALEVIEKYMF